VTRIAQCGWETGDAQQAGSVGAVNSGMQVPTAATTAPTPRSGAYCLKCALVAGAPSGSTLNASYSRATIAHATATEVWYAFGFQWTHSQEPGSFTWVMLHALGADGNVNVVLSCDAGTIRAYAATGGTTNPNNGSNITSIGAASSAMSASAWHLVEVRLIASTTTGGTCQVYVDGTQVINATGVRTAQTSATYATVALSLGAWQSVSSSTCTHAFDDFRVNSTAGAVNNGRPGDESIRLVVPSAPGDLTQLTRGGTDSGANWSQVEEVPASTADYVTGAGAGLTDLYNTSDLAPTSVSAVQVLALGSNPSGGGTVALVTKTPAGQSAGTAVGLTTAWAWTSRLLEVDPADSAAWTSAKLASLQIGCAVG
jgi:hypothetical protein